jgi:hypothetical protein
MKRARDRYNAVGRDCVRRDLSTTTSAKDLHPALCRITDSYNQMFIDEPIPVSGSLAYFASDSIVRSP